MLYKYTAMRSLPFLSDHDVWVMYCAARLAELDTAGRSLESFEPLARALHDDDVTRALGAVAAAERYRAGTAQVAA